MSGPDLNTSRPIDVDRKPSAGCGTITLGYQGRDLAEVLQIVRQQHIEQVVDIRDRATSKKPGFSATELHQALARMGVGYSHLPELGCTSESRHALWRGKPLEPFLDAYRRRLAQRPEAFTDLVRRVRSAPTLLLCLERDPSRCHRAVLVEKLRGEGIFPQNL
jgi:uncharacterized protein (DUF488 family)